MNQYVNYIQEENLDIPTTGTHEEQVKSCETLLDRMKEIVQQKVELNKKKEEMLKTVNEIFETSQCHEDVVDNYHDKIVFKLLDLEDEKHQNRLESMKKEYEKQVKEEKERHEKENKNWMINLF